MAGETKRVDLKETWIYAGKHYGPGKNIEVPADFRGGTPSKIRAASTTGGAGGSDEGETTGPKLVKNEGEGDEAGGEETGSAEAEGGAGESGTTGEGGGEQTEGLAFADVPGRAEFEAEGITTIAAVRQLHADEQLTSVKGIGPARAKQVAKFLESAGGSEG